MKTSNEERGLSMRQSAVVSTARCCLVVLSVIFSATPASAITYLSLQDQEIVHRAELVIEGTVAETVSPANADRLNKDAVSIATIKVTRASSRATSRKAKR